MNKTIIININGTVFHIEEDAYEILKAYMTDVKRHFMNSADSLEITTDIENRIAEMLNDKLANDHKQVIVEQDVRDVIEQMGTVQDFEIAEEDEIPNYNRNYTTGAATARRLFRDPDDHLVGGVCAGIANYFDIQVVWMRVAFAILMFAGGTGLFLYIILWAVIPKAATRADRMAMKGEKLDLKGFKKNFEEEMSGLRENFSNFSNEARPFVYKARDFSSDFFGHFGYFIKGTAKVFVKILAIIALLTCFSALIAFIVTIVAFLAFNNSGLYQLFPFNLANHDVNTVFLVSSFLVLSIPLLVIIMLILSSAFKSRGLSKTSGSILFIVWICAISLVFYHIARVSTDFREEARFTQNISIKPTKDNVYHLKLNDIRYFTAEDSLRYHLKEKFHGPIILDADDDEMRDWPGRSVGLEIIKSDVPQPVLEETFEARGGTFEDALSNAQGITYRFSQSDSTLLFDRRIQKPLARLFRDQNVHLKLKLPLNAKVIIDEDMDRILDGGISVSNCNSDNKRDYSMPSTYNMTGNGLQCKVDTTVTATNTAGQAKPDSSKDQ